MNWSLPENIATYGGKIDAVFWVITVVTAIAFVLVEVGIIWFCVKYRRREGHRAFYTHGSKSLEVLWTAVPALAMVALGFYSANVWAQIKGRNSAPSESLQISVRAKQFEWNVTYAGADEVLGTSDDFSTRNQLHFPANRARMAGGEALNDADRAPWLDALQSVLRAHLDRQAPVVMACSALKRRYRRRLRPG
ncbi:MAG: cytochrome c oxidase subunit II transmembrane domain-containing protein, partial [Gemmatimonadales bacterium]